MVVLTCFPSEYKCSHHQSCCTVPALSLREQVVLVLVLVVGFCLLVLASLASSLASKVVVALAV